MSMIGFAGHTGDGRTPEVLDADEEISVEGLAQERRFLCEHRRPARIVFDYLNLIHARILVSRDASDTIRDKIAVRRVRHSRRCPHCGSDRRR
jgi:hypothetical protein